MDDFGLRFAAQWLKQKPFDYMTESNMHSRYSDIETLGQLKESGWTSVPVQEEIRNNLIAKIKVGETLFPGIRGYNQSVIPELQHALLAKHDFILLGLRGQAKTRILRQLTSFLNEYRPGSGGLKLMMIP